MQLDLLMWDGAIQKFFCELSLFLFSGNTLTFKMKPLSWAKCGLNNILEVKFSWRTTSLQRSLIYITVYDFQLCSKPPGLLKTMQFPSFCQPLSPGLSVAAVPINRFPMPDHCTTGEAGELGSGILSVAAWFLAGLKSPSGRRQWHPTRVLLPGKSHGRRSLVGCSPWGRKESDTTERLHFHFPLSCIGDGNGNPLQCSCLENPRDGGAWWAAVYGVKQSWTRLKRLSSSRSRVHLGLPRWH